MIHRLCLVSQIVTVVTHCQLVTQTMTKIMKWKLKMPFLFLMLEIIVWKIIQHNTVLPHLGMTNIPQGSLTPYRARLTIKRDNRLLITEALPILSVSNLRSIWPRLNNFKTEVILRGISCALLSEVWEKANCSKQQFELEKMLNMDGLKYISTPRMTKRGGGAAIVANLKKFSLDKIEVSNPDKVEVVFGC